MSKRRSNEDLINEFKKKIKLRISEQTIETENQSNSVNVARQNTNNENSGAILPGQPFENVSSEGIQPTEAHTAATQSLENQVN